MTGTLSKTGEKRLAHYEQLIESGLATFQKVGDALLSIREEKLYRADHDTFETYCKKRWGFSDRRARQLMSAAEIGTVVPVSNEAQARALAPIKDDPDALREVHQQATAASNGTEPTASTLSKYVKNLKQVPEVAPEEQGAREFIDAVAREHPEWELRDRFDKERKHVEVVLELSIFDVVTAIAVDEFTTRDLHEFCDRLAAWAGAVAKLLDQPLRSVK